MSKPRINAAMVERAAEASVKHTAPWAQWNRLDPWRTEFERERTRAMLEAAIPPDWKLVPVEPTEEMGEASAKYIGREDAIRAAIAAAPEPWADDDGCAS